MLSICLLLVLTADAFTVHRLESGSPRGFRSWSEDQHSPSIIPEPHHSMVQIQEDQRSFTSDDEKQRTELKPLKSINPYVAQENATSYFKSQIRDYGRKERANGFTYNYKSYTQKISPPILCFRRSQNSLQEREVAFPNNGNSSENEISPFLNSKICNHDPQKYATYLHSSATEVEEEINPTTNFRNNQYRSEKKVTDSISNSGKEVSVPANGLKFNANSNKVWMNPSYSLGSGAYKLQEVANVSKCDTSGEKKMNPNIISRIDLHSLQKMDSDLKFNDTLSNVEIHPSASFRDNHYYPPQRRNYFTSDFNLDEAKTTPSFSSRNTSYGHREGTGIQDEWKLTPILSSRIINYAPSERRKSTMVNLSPTEAKIYPLIKPEIKYYNLDENKNGIRKVHSSDDETSSAFNSGIDHYGLLKETNTPMNKYYSRTEDNNPSKYNRNCHYNTQESSIRHKDNYNASVKGQAKLKSLSTNAKRIKSRSKPTLDDQLCSCLTKSIHHILPRLAQHYEFDSKGTVCVNKENDKTITEESMDEENERHEVYPAYSSSEHKSNNVLNEMADNNKSKTVFKRFLFQHGHKNKKKHNKNNDDDSTNALYSKPRFPKSIGPNELTTGVFDLGLTKEI